MKDKKRVAAIAAVMAYYGSAGAGGAAVQEAEAARGKAVRATTAAAPMNYWGMSGRQAQMQMRGLMQMKSFHGAKLR